MVAVDEAMLAYIAQTEGIDQRRMAYLGGGRADSDGIVYRIPGERVLKIVHIPRDSRELTVEKTRLRLEFSAFLYKQEVPVICPVPMAEGALFRTVAEGDDLFLYYQMERAQGVPLRRRGADSALHQRYGELVGAAHAATGDFTLYANRNLENAYRALSWEQEGESFLGLCRDEGVRERWREMLEQLRKLPRTRDSFGMIHNDPHAENVLVAEDDSLMLLDFDVSCFHYFATDIAIAAQHVAFGESGGIDRPMDHPEVLELFLADFRRGYERRHTLEPLFWEKLPLFLHYRSLLLFTVMQDWLETQPESLESWRGTILAADYSR